MLIPNNIIWTNPALKMHCEALVNAIRTDIVAYNDTGYSNTRLTVKVLVNPKLPKSFTISRYLLTVTLFPCPESVNVTEDVCITDSMVGRWR